MHHIKDMRASTTTLRALTGIAVACMALTSCGGDKKTTEKTAEEKPVVKIEEVFERDVPQVFTYTAETEADKINNISSSTPLRIKSILVEEGQRVSKGQSLVILDDVNTTTYQLQVDNAKAQVDNAEAQLANVKLDYDRAVQLFKIGGGTRQQVDQMHTQLVSAQNGVVTARNSLASAKRALANASENSVLTSPVAGVVTARNYDPGDMTGSLPILTVSQVQPMKTVINVSETEYSRIHTGMPARVMFDTYGNEIFHGTVSKILPTVDPSTRTFAVEIDIPNSDSRILPGMFARVELDLGTQRHVVVPDRAVVKQQGSGNQYVYVYADGKVSYNKVEIGQRIGDSYELLSGVPSGAKVVITGQNALSNGKEVKVMK